MTYWLRYFLLGTLLLVACCATSAAAKPEWTFRVVVAVERQTATYYENAYSKSIELIVNEQMATVNANFNSSLNFNGIYKFRVDSVYVFDGSAQNEIFRSLTTFDYRMVINSFSPVTSGGGWYGSYHTIYHNWPWNYFNGPFGSTATDGVTHEFGHARGAIDIYALQVDAQNNPVNGTPFVAISSIMNYPYGNILWDEHSTNILNATGGSPIVGEQYITGAFPDTMRLKVTDAQGAVLPFASVTVYPVDWYSNTLSASPIITALTNNTGYYRFSANPFGPANNGYPWHIRYCNFLIKAFYNGVASYQWMPLYDVQNQYFRNGAASTYTAVVAVPASATNIQLTSISGTSFCPDESFTASFTVAGSFQPGNTFTLQVLGDNTGTFNYESTTSVSGTSLTGQIPNLTPGQYSVRISSTNPVRYSNIYLITIKPWPNSPTVQALYLCLNAPVPVQLAQGQNLLWYPSINGGVGSPTPPVINTSQISFHSYYVSQTVGECESPRTVLPVTVGPLQTIKSGLWNDSTIWSCKRVPTEADEPIISSGTSVTISGTKVSARRIIYQSGAKLIFLPDGWLSLGANSN